MKKKLKSSGNGWELYFAKPLLKLLRYNPVDIYVLITAKNDCLTIEPIAKDESAKYADAMVRSFQKSGRNGYGLYFPSSLIEYLEIEPDEDFLDINIDENIMYIRKAN